MWVAKMPLILLKTGIKKEASERKQRAHTPNRSNILKTTDQRKQRKKGPAPMKEQERKTIHMHSVCARI